MLKRQRLLLVVACAVAYASALGLARPSDGQLPSAETNAQRTERVR